MHALTDVGVARSEGSLDGQCPIIPTGQQNEDVVFPTFGPIDRIWIDSVWSIISFLYTD